MKLLTVTVPCYNSEAYMEHCIKSLLSGGDRVEIIIIDDGSKDRTGEIADRLAAEHSDIIKAVHQENGGHGEGINVGLRNATGVYSAAMNGISPEMTIGAATWWWKTALDVAMWTVAGLTLIAWVLWLVPKKKKENE